MSIDGIGQSFYNQSMFKHLFPAKTSIIMICTANICRSPMAEGMLRQRIQRLGLSKKFRVDSAGTRATQPGHRPDARVQRLMAEAGIGLRGIKARQVTEKDMVSNDYILVMDNANYAELVEICPPEHRAKIRLLMSFASGLGVAEVPDPYFGSIAGFDEVFRLIDEAVGNLVQKIVKESTT